MRNYKKSILALGAACSLNISCASRLIWQVNINGTANGDDAAFAVGVDTNGDVVAVGRTRNTASGDDFTVVKFDAATGAIRWRQTINGTANQDDWGRAVTVDANGDVVAGGYTRNSSTDFTVVKFAGTRGEEIWRQVIGHGFAHTVTADKRGDVVAAGAISAGTGHDFAVVKFDGVAGTELWRQMINGRANHDDYVSAVKVDAKGDVVAVGSTRNMPEHPIGDFAVVKFDGANGAEMWRTIIPGTSSGSSGASAVTVDGEGSVLAAGFTVGSDLSVSKFEGVTGAEVWRQAINGTANGVDFATAVALDGKGDVVVVGFIQNIGTGNDFSVVKFEAITGRELWRQTINGTANGEDRALAASVDSFDNVVAAGYITNTGTGNDLTVVKFDGASGTELWRQVIDGTMNGYDFAYSVMMDAAGDVIAAGVTRNTGTGVDFTVVKVRGN
jgi:outer membrane protein assembly factor BamB